MAVWSAWFFYLVCRLEKAQGGQPPYLAYFLTYVIVAQVVFRIIEFLNKGAAIGQVKSCGELQWFCSYLKLVVIT